MEFALGAVLLSDDKRPSQTRQDDRHGVGVCVGNGKVGEELKIREKLFGESDEWSPSH